MSSREIRSAGRARTDPPVLPRVELTSPALAMADSNRRTTTGLVLTDPAIHSDVQGFPSMVASNEAMWTATAKRQFLVMENM